MTTAKPIHPILKELGLASNNDGGGGTQAPPAISSRDVLQFLLETSVISSDQLKAAHASLKERHNQEAAEKAAAAAEKAQADVTAFKSEYRTRHIALRVYYEGKRYNGLAQTVGMEADNSVERHLFAALQKTHLIHSRDTCKYSRCGRTDKGVSAVGQVVAMRLKSAIPLQASWDQDGLNLVPDTPQGETLLPKNSTDRIAVWVPPKARNGDNKSKKKDKKKAKLNPSASTTQAKPATLNGDNTSTNNANQGPRVQKEAAEYTYDKILNSVLPDDIRVLGWCPVSEEFSARFSAAKRTYRYFFVRRNLDLDAMRQGLQRMIGTHDFRNLCKLNVVEVSNYVRKILSADVISCSSGNGDDGGGSNNFGRDVYYFQIEGQAFLWHQIRCIVEIMFMIGRHLESPSVVTELLNVEKYPGKPSYPPASEFPLVLHECGYPNLQIGYSVPSLWNITCQMEEQWEKIILEAARVRNCLDMLKQDVHLVRKDDLVVFAKQRLLERNKKQRRNHALSKNEAEWTSYLAEIKGEVNKVEKAAPIFMTWEEAMQWLNRWKLIPGPNGLRENVHIPLLERSKGTTYEEKIQAIQEAGATKRSQRYNENVSKKRKSEGTDEEFYNHMLKQGGSAK